MHIVVSNDTLIPQSINNTNEQIKFYTLTQFIELAQSEDGIEIDTDLYFNTAILDETLYNELVKFIKYDIKIIFYRFVGSKPPNFYIKEGVHLYNVPTTNKTTNKSSLTTFVETLQSSSTKVNNTIISTAVDRFIKLNNSYLHLIYINKKNHKVNVPIITISNRLTKSCINDLIDLVKDERPLTKDIANVICIGENPDKPCTQVYGIYNNNKLISIMTATYSIVFPHMDGTKVVQISGAYTHPDYRHKGYATKLLKIIEKDAKKYFKADYICLDSEADELYTKNGYIKSKDSRLWKKLK